jgi:hypothetical protein
MLRRAQHDGLAAEGIQRHAQQTESHIISIIQLNHTT